MTGDDLGLITRRIKAAETTSNPEETLFQDKALVFHSPSDTPEIVHACETLIEHLKNMRGSMWLAASNLFVWLKPSWRKAWQTKEDVMFELVENSRRKLGKAQCAMDEVMKRSALLGSRG